MRVLFAFLMMISLAYSQEFTIEGVVQDTANNPLPGVTVLIKNTNKGTQSDFDGKFSIKVKKNDILVFSYVGMRTKEVIVKNEKPITVTLGEDNQILEEVVITSKERAFNKSYDKNLYVRSAAIISEPEPTETYRVLGENKFKNVSTDPISTFSADVDRASYSNVRRMINNGQFPHKDAVRIEEMINYFDYEYPQPTDKTPFKASTQLSYAPWNTDHYLLQIGLQAKKIDLEKTAPSNIVFLIDVSGSMDAPNKLPLLKSSLKMLVNSLKKTDKVAIVVYAGSSGVVLPSTSASEKTKIIEALDRLQAGGSTAGGQGLKLAYKIARENFIPNGNNRILLATDGDFNVGVNNNDDLQRLVEKERESGVYISVLGYGMGNYRDDMAETIANKGNGNYAYIDNLMEAKKTLVNEFGGTFYTVAKDVKLQLEFNPKYVKEYRLIGYENRMLNTEDFEDDTKDAGEIGSGHTVTVLYEIVPANGKLANSLRYQTLNHTTTAEKGRELAFLKMRYKNPEDKSEKSILVETPIQHNILSLEKTDDNFRFSASVAEFGMLLRDSEFKGKSNYPQVIELAEGALSNDKEGYRREFIRLVKSAELMKK